jgi:hypothetical protein
MAKNKAAVALAKLRREKMTPEERTAFHRAGALASAAKKRQKKAGLK